MVSSNGKQRSSHFYLENVQRYWKKVIYKNVEYHRFSTKIHLMDINAKN